MKEEHVDQCRTLTKWCLKEGLWGVVLQGVTLVLGMDPAPWVARGPRGVDQLAKLVYEMEGAARKVQTMIVVR
jgi:hypothetical protein